MDVSCNSQSNLNIITERIIKTDEVLRLLDVKKKEVNKLDKKYKKLLEKFCTKNNEVSNSNTSLEKKIEELKSENEILQKNHSEYINQAENKYQSACQEVNNLNEACKVLTKKVAKLEQKESKTKTKKLQDNLNDVQKELKLSLLKYKELEASSNKTISDLKHEHKQLEEKKNETLKQLAEVNNNTLNNQALEDKILKLESKIASFEVEVDILNQNHNTEIMKIKKQYDTEKSMLENELIQLKIEFKSNKYDESEQGKQIKDLEEKYETENKLLREEVHNLNKKISENIQNNLKVVNEKTKENLINEDDVSQLKKLYENEKNILEKQLQTLSGQLNVCVEKHNEEKKNLISDIEKLTNIITDLKDKSKETCGTQTNYEDIYNLEDILAEMHDIPDLISPFNSPSVKLEVKQDVVFVETRTCSLAVGSDEIIPNFIDCYTDTADFITFIECSTQTDHFNLQSNTVEPMHESISKDLNRVSTIDSSTQTENEYSIKEPKNKTLSSKIINRSNTDNENKLLITLKNSKLNVKNSLEQYMNNNSKYIIESSADCNKVKISEIPDTHISNTYIFEQNQKDLCHNNYCRLQCDDNHHIFCNNSCHNKISRTKYNSSDTSSSDSEDDSKFEELIKDYNNFVIQKYYSNKYLIRSGKKKRRGDFQDIKNIKKHKSHYSCSDSEKKNIFSDINPININFTENTITADEVKEAANFSMESNLNIRKDNQIIEKSSQNLNPVIEKENIQEFEENIPEFEENNQKEFVAVKIPNDNEVNKRKSSDKQIVEKSQKYPFSLSKKQNQILRRGNRTTNNITLKKPVVPVRKSVRLKKKDLITDYNKKKIEIFGIDSGSSDNDESNEFRNQSGNNVSRVEQIPVVQESQNKNNDYTYTLNLRTEEHSQNIPETVLENTLNSTNVLENKNPTTLINNPSDKLETQKVFKKPVKAIHDVSFAANTIKVTENCIKEVENVQVININVAEKLISDVVTLKWDHDLMTTVVNYLVNKDMKIVLKLIVNEAAKDFSQELDKSFSPPAPLLTVAQQKILVLISQLEKNNEKNVHSIFLETLEKTLLAESRVEVVYPLTRLYVATCKLKYEIEKVRMLCCNAAYYMGDLLLPLMFIVLTTWGDVLPMADSSEDIPLAISLVYVIHLKTCTKPGYNSMNLHRLLTDYYGYKRGDKSNEDIFTILFRYYTDTYSKAAYTAIIILCKNLPSKWTYNQISNHLLPLIESSNNDSNELLTISLIQRLIEVFHIDIDKEYIIDIRNKLAKYVISTNVTS